MEVIEKLTAQKVCAMINEPTVPTPLEFVVTEVAIKRYNRLTNEGMKSYSQEGLSITFEDDDFAEFQAFIDKWIGENKPELLNGWVVFKS